MTRTTAVLIGRAMRKRKSTGPGRRVIAVDSGDSGTSYTIYSDDKEGRMAVYLRHLERTGNKPLAALRAGMSKSGLSAWRRDDPEFREKERDAVYAASAKFIGKVAAAAMRGDVKAATWMTEKLNPEEYGRNDHIQIELTPPPRLARRSWSEIPTLESADIGQPADQEEVEATYRDLTSDAAQPAEVPENEPPPSTALVIRPLD
jgi:hypothetical protein